MELVGRWARAALDRLLSSTGPAPSVFLAGEPGTGRRQLARAFHDRRHPESRAPLEIVHRVAGATDDELYGAIFGREGRRPGVRGGLYWPGPIERARGGTVVIEGPDRFPPRVVEALAAYAETGELRPLGGDARRAGECAVFVIAPARKYALLRELAERCDAAIQVPSLRERVGDIEDLFWHFAKVAGFGGFPARAAAHFAALPWPGNVPELREMVRAEAAYWLDSCASPGKSREEVDHEIRRTWAPRVVPADTAAAGAALKKKTPIGRARGTKKEVILSLAEEISKGTLAPREVARRAMASVSYTRQVLRKAGVEIHVRGGA